jgi:hypothetical protein
MDKTEAMPTSCDAGDEIAEKARELASLRDGSRTSAESCAEVAAGLSSLAETASRRGQGRISRACKALSAILSRVDHDRKEDADFILSTALHFLDALQAKRVHTGREMA